VLADDRPGAVDHRAGIENVGHLEVTEREAVVRRGRGAERWCRRLGRRAQAPQDGRDAEDGGERAESPAADHVAAQLVHGTCFSRYWRPGASGAADLQAPNADPPLARDG